jgi:2-keto-4-pentenoate hydratase
VLNEETRATPARRLRDAESDVLPIVPLTDDPPDMAPDDAFEIQLVDNRRRLVAGVVVTGHKAGLVSKAMQEMMGVDEPDYGHLIDTIADNASSCDYVVGEQRVQLVHQRPQPVALPDPFDRVVPLECGQ